MRIWLLALALSLAGCTTADDDPSGDDRPDTGTGGTGGHGNGGAGFAPQTGHDEATDHKAPGLVLRGDMWACEQGYCVNVTAQNTGSRTYHVSSICVTPWSENVTQEGRRVDHREPMAVCLAFGTSPFAPGAEAHYESAWNGTLYNGQKDRYEDAPQGGYDWNITFTAYDESGGDGKHDLTVTFHVLIGIAT